MNVFAAAAFALAVGATGPGWAAFEMILPQSGGSEIRPPSAGGAPDRTARPMQEPALPEDSSCIVTVNAGDTLAGITARTLGDSKRWRELAEFNRISDPDRIAAGWRLAWPCTADQASGDDIAAIARDALDSLGPGDDSGAVGNPENVSKQAVAADPEAGPNAQKPENARIVANDANATAKVQLDDPEVTPGLVRAEAAAVAQISDGGVEAAGDVQEAARADASVVNRTGTATVQPVSSGDRVDEASCSITVMKGDSLADLAGRELGDRKRWPEIARLNRLPDPDRIAAGDELRLPCDFRHDNVEPGGQPAIRQDPEPVENAEKAGENSNALAWTAAPGEMLDDVIVRWALQAGWQPIVSERWYWRFGTEYTFVGRFNAAIFDVLEGFPATGTAPGIKYYDNQVIELIYR